ncbi:MAG: Uma2 family endonuclease [Alphaproteobacteria bacterium]|nr:Uma2 family endonuclease [Alphaproteobacteria bacterium]
MAEPAAEKLTQQAFLGWEREQSLRFEYDDGAIYCMVGGTAAHSRIASNVSAILRGQLQGGPCEAFQEGLKVQMDRAIFYPDVVVTCSQVPDQVDIVPAPVMIVAVLSPSTAADDRGRKWLHYRTIPTLRYYVLVAQNEALVELDARTGDGWQHTTLAGIDAVIQLAEPAAGLALRDIYAGTNVARAAS